MRNTACLFAFGLLLTVCASGEALATIPSECNDDGGLERFYNLGVVKGQSLVNQAWDGLGEPTCDNDLLWYFPGIVIEAFEAGAPGPDSPIEVYCHYVGSYVGAIERVDELLGVGCNCMHSYLEGDMIGEMAAIFYCELSIALGGLGLDEWLVQGELSYCGEEFVEACEERFDDLTQSYPSAVDPQCLPYTPYYDPPDYEEVWEQTQHNQCIYSIE
jgi:hypothetical protein